MTEQIQLLAKQVAELTARLKTLEAKGSTTRKLWSRISDFDNLERQCSLPEVPERTFLPDVSSDRARLIRMIDKKWVNGTKLRYFFFDSGPYEGASNQKQLVREGFDVWTDVEIGISFEEVTNVTDAEVRVGFLLDDGTWSYLGRDVIDIPGQYERTMNFGWDLTGDPRGVDTPVHEIGHTLGFPHAHSNPFAGIIWNEEAVYDYFAGPPNNWSQQTTFYNVLRKLPASAVEGSEWDKDSIMQYGFPAGLIVSPEEFQDGLRPELGLSDYDITQARQFYPPLDDIRNPKLEPFRLEFLSLAPGEQKNFSIEPQNTEEYIIQTFGRSDVVMILFEDVDGELRFVAGDDDSGTNLNAQIFSRLRQGRRYVLRIRLYLNYASGDTVVMMW